MVGRDDDIGCRGKPELIQRLAQIGEIVVGILDGRERGRSIDTRRNLQRLSP